MTSRHQPAAQTADGPHWILLNPGPVNLSARVRQALLRVDLCHRQAEFLEFQETIRQQLLAVYDLDPARWAAVLLGGSGTTAVEAMLTSMVPRAGHLLVLENGVYGERCSEIAGLHGIRHEDRSQPWTAALDPAALEHRLSTGSQVSHVAVVHHETTTGRLNRLDQIAARCRTAGCRLLVDAVSSFGAEAIDFEGWEISALVGTANKCLHAVPGISFVIVRRADLQPLDPARSLSLDLFRHCQAQDRRDTLFTPPVQCCYALSEALLELQEEGGWQARRQRYRQRAATLAAGLAELGMEALLDRQETSASLCSYHLPAGMDYPQLAAALKKQGFIIYAGQGPLAGTIFRIANMGALEDRDMERLVQVFGELPETSS